MEHSSQPDSKPQSSELDSKEALRETFALLTEDAQDVRGLIFYGVLISFFSLIVPLSVQALVNTVAFGSLLQPLVVLSIGVLGFLLLSAALKLTQLGLIERLQVRVFTRVALRLGLRLGKLSFLEYASKHLTSRVNRFLDISIIQKSIATLLSDGVTLALQTVVSLVLVSFYHPLLLGYAVLLMAVLGGIVWTSFWSGVYSAKKESSAKHHVSEFLEEVVENPLTHRSSRLSGALEQKLDTLVLNYQSARSAHYQVIRKQFLGVLLLQAFFSALLLGGGAVLVVRGQLSLGQLVAAEVLVSSLLVQVSKLSKISESFFDLVAAVGKVKGLLFLSVEESGILPFHSSREIGKTGVSVEFRSVRVQSIHSPTIRSDASLDLQVTAGETLAIIGRNGAGKSTLINLLYGLQRPDSGSILFNGEPLAELALEQVRRSVSLVKGSQFFEGTLLENLLMGSPLDHLPQIRHWIREFDLEECVLALSLGLNTPIQASHPPFSKGQIQKLMLIRAMVGSPPLILLDEAMDSLDGESKAEMMDVFLRGTKGSTVVIATHSLEFARRCDRIFRLEGGTLKAVSHDELIRNASVSKHSETQNEGSLE